MAQFRVIQRLPSRLASKDSISRLSCFDEFQCRQRKVQFLGYVNHFKFHFWWFNTMVCIVHDIMVVDLILITSFLHELEACQVN
jgi:hypothetical protein